MIVWSSTGSSGKHWEEVRGKVPQGETAQFSPVLYILPPRIRYEKRLYHLPNIFFFFNHCFRMKLKGTVCKYLSNATEASRAHVPKAEPSEAEGNQCKNEGSQLQTTLPEKHWMGRTHPAPSPQSSPLQRPLHWKHLPHSGPGASLPPSALIFWGRTSLFSQGSPLWMHNFIFGSVNPSLPCDQHSTPRNPALHAHLPGSGNGAKDRSASAMDSSDYDQTRNFLFFWVFSLHQL